MPIGQPRLQLRCDEQSPVLQCHALAFDEPATDPGIGRDVTDTVHWTSSDEQSVSVQRGRISAKQGTAIVTAAWTERPAAPSASVMVVADGRHGAAHQAYVLEGEVRTFPTSDGVAGAARVTLIDDTGFEQTVTTPSREGAPGSFRFAPVAAGTYQLRAVRDGYRSNQVSVVLPHDTPRNITLLKEPRDHS
jgi:Carboxypeptidase regulatory-like domain